MSLDFKAAHAILARDVRGLCMRLFPKGQQKGVWWVTSVPWREDRTPSLGISLTTGYWKDFGRGEGGDLPGLLAKIQNRSAADIVRELMP